MTSEQFLELVNETHLKRTELMGRKSGDYATDDKLSNFKRLSIACSLWNINVTTPVGACMFFKLVKFDRLCNLIFNSKDEKCESKDDTIYDDMNYDDLLKALLKECK